MDKLCHRQMGVPVPALPLGSFGLGANHYLPELSLLLSETEMIIPSLQG